MRGSILEGKPGQCSLADASWRDTVDAFASSYGNNGANAFLHPGSPVPDFARRREIARQYFSSNNWIKVRGRGKCSTDFGYTIASFSSLNATLQPNSALNQGSSVRPCINDAARRLRRPVSSLKIRTSAVTKLDLMTIAQPRNPRYSRITVMFVL